MLSMMMTGLAAVSVAGRPYEGLAAPCATYQRIIDVAATDFADILGEYRPSLDYATSLKMPRASDCMIEDRVPRRAYKCQWEFPKGVEHEGEAKVQASSLVQDLNVCPLHAEPAEVAVENGLAVEVPGKAIIKVSFGGYIETGWTVQFEIEPIARAVGAIAAQGWTRSEDAEHGTVVCTHRVTGLEMFPEDSAPAPGLKGRAFAAGAVKADDGTFGLAYRLRKDDRPLVPVFDNFILPEERISALGASIAKLGVSIDGDAFAGASHMDWSLWAPSNAKAFNNALATGRRLHLEFLDAGGRRLAAGSFDLAPIRTAMALVARANWEC